MSHLYPITLGIAAYLGYSGYRKGSLSLDGAITASIVGYASMANPFVGYGLTLITFYLTGSKATKFKAKVKEGLETHSTQPSTSKVKVEGRGRDTSLGNRNAVQVLCNSLTAVLACVAFRFLNRDASIVDPLSTSPLIVINVAGTGVNVTNLALTLLISGHYAACMGDTLASELGILSRSPPRLVTNPLRTVPRGTNGGISPLGLLVSALGGCIIALSQSIALVYHGGERGWWVHGRLGVVLTVAGLGGSLVDSLLGATLQQTLYNAKTGRVFVGQVTDVLDGKKADDRDVSWKAVTGWNVLSNNAVNFIASASTALLTAWLGSKLF
ncbi:uncharacterized protein SPSC_06330 [Sporisorium scitamineum]|uniref:Transmembrane protein 19 n=1 Tax=Sporisorium scitamineum TaxID=49012 RepID=A0A0F7RYR6_9BASI|nr:uncharacterized protein SPSC_06330 [Sporisorium scitamineum]CDS02131.1 hypothetical protein [Sporisorium scitamineum]